MMRFRFRAAQPDGRVVLGVLSASSEAELDALLVAQGLAPIANEPLTTRSVPAGYSRRDLAVLFRSLATLVAAGIPLERALSASESLPRKAALRAAVRDTRELLRQGFGLAEALKRSGGPVPGVVLGMLRAGERGSHLSAALEQAANQLERDADLASRVRQALAYPLILLVAGSLSVGVITMVVIPRFAVVLGDAGLALPPATRLLIQVATFLRAYSLQLLVLSVAAVTLFISWYRTPAGQREVHRTLLQLPALGATRHSFASARVARALGALLSSGVPALSALDAAMDAVGDAEVAARLRRARQRVAEGEAIAAALRDERALTSPALQLLMVGDSSGQLGTMALRAGDLAALEGEGRLRVLVGSLEPALVILFGGLVAFTAAALLQAVYSLRPGA